jgi:hypothetical protein
VRASFRGETEGNVEGKKEYAYAYLRIRVFPVPEDLHGENDLRRARQKEGQVPEVR